MLVISFLLTTMLAVLVTAHFLTVQKNYRHSSFQNQLNDLRRIAESGVNQSLHELTFGGGQGDGHLGTENWVLANDLGRDGRPMTYDEGERDGMPTPGEPNVSPVLVSEPRESIGLFTHTSDSAWAGIQRVVSTAYNPTALAIVEVYVRVSPYPIPGAGAAYVQEGVVLDLKGSAFTISGADTNPDGTTGSSSPVYGIATDLGDPPGTNSTELIDQVPSSGYDQITGTGGSPSIGETTPVDFEGLLSTLKTAADVTLNAGTYNSVGWGDYRANDFQVTYCKGDITLTGAGRGAGALVVEGSLNLSGTCEYVGLVIVKGDVRIIGGGSGIHLYGSLLVGQSLTAIDPDPEVTVAGSADILYSSWALGQVSSLLPLTRTVLYWNDVR